MSNYIPFELEKIFPKLDIDKLNEYMSSESKTPKTETIDYLLSQLNLSSEKIKNNDVLIRNYIYTTVVARKHLIEINNRLQSIETEKAKINDKDSYKIKKLEFFKKKNEQAKNEIIEFLCFGILEYLIRRNDNYADLIDRDNEELMWLIGPTYDYQYNSQYYNYDYDFSTSAKFYEIPNISILDSLKNIELAIKIKKDSFDEYLDKVKSTVDDNMLMSKLVERVSNNYHIHQRKEIFETLNSLFNENRYLTFIITATIQLEGMFHELVSIKYGKKEKQGTLVEKVERAFSKEPFLKQTLYPYFAFDIPELRNQAAHKGLIDCENLELLAYELVLDLNCIISLVEKESTDKFKNIIVIANKLDEIDEKNFDSYDEYKKGLQECLLLELYRNNFLRAKYFWELLTDPDSYEEEMNYYMPESKEDDEVSLKDLVKGMINIINEEGFWEVALESSKYISSININAVNDFGSFLEKLKNEFICRLTGESKKFCCQLSQRIEQIKMGKEQKSTS